APAATHRSTPPATGCSGACGTAYRPGRGATSHPQERISAPRDTPSPPWSRRAIAGTPWPWPDVLLPCVPAISALLQLPAVKVFVFVGQRQDVVITPQVIKVVAQIHRSIAVFGQFLQHFISQPRRFQILSGMKEIALVFAHHARIVIHRARRAVHPKLG